jgi:hypothetical protein
MDLAELVRKYTQISGGFGRAVHLSQFGLSKAETEDDYQISRYMVLSRERDEELVSYAPQARVYSISGFEVSHVSFSPEIRKVL